MGTARHSKQSLTRHSKHLRRDDELKSQLLNSYHHVMCSSADYFRSKCSRKSWRPRKGTRGNDKQQTDNEAGWASSALSGNAAAFESYFWPYQPVYDASYAWEHALYESTMGSAGCATGMPPWRVSDRLHHDNSAAPLETTAFETFPRVQNTPLIDGAKVRVLRPCDDPRP
jgi:hypothetical protein